MKHARYLVAAVVSATTLAMYTGPMLAQPRTISHQGVLTDISGAVVADASRHTTFRIYNVDSGGAALWTEAQNVETGNGVFNVILGAINPIDGFSLQQDLWLGTTISGESEFSPRTKLTGAPYAHGLTMPLKDSLWIQTLNFATDGSESRNEELTIHASDAQIGLYSDLSGDAGSGIQLGEIFASALTDKWAMYRNAGGSDSFLRFSYGSNADYAANSTMVEINENGGIEASSFEYPDPGSVRRHGVNATAFRPTLVSSAVSYSADRSQAYISSGAEVMLAPVFLPDGAVLDTLDCYVYDTSAHDLDCQLVGGLITGGVDVIGLIVGSIAASSGTPGAMKISAALGGHVVNNGQQSLAVRVQPATGSWSTEGSNFRVKMAVIKYRVLEAG